MKILSMILCVFFAQHFFAQEENTTTITVVIENLKTDEGAVRGSLFTEKTFLTSNPESTAKAEIKDGFATLIFENVPKGIYGITAFHDENGNGRMDLKPAVCLRKITEVPIINLILTGLPPGVMPGLKLQVRQWILAYVLCVKL